jgi:hypothetical protein
MSEIYVDPGDIVIWNNESADTVWINFDPADGTPFARTETTLFPWSQRTQKVREDAGVATYSYTLKCGSGGIIGGPEVKVGGGGGTP